MIPNFICIGDQMPYQSERPTLLGFVCSPFITSITKKPFFGGPYVLGVDLLKLEAHIYQVGAVLGRALQHRLDILVKLLFVPGTEEHNVNRVVALCKKDVKKNLEEFQSQFGREPVTFDDFIFYRGIESLLRTGGIALSPRDAYEAYLHGDKKTKKLFDQKVDSKGVGQRIMTVLLQGIFFGSSFPELTKTMYQEAWQDDRDFWSDTWAHGLVIAEELRAASLEEAEQAVLQIAAVYASEYYPEFIDALGLRAFLQQNNSRVDTQAYEPSKYEILNEILLREGTNLIRKSIKHPELLGQPTLSVSTNPFNPSDSEYLTQAFLSGPSHMGHFDTERLEIILKKLLQDDYERYYETARQNIASKHTRPPSGKGNKRSD